MKREKENPPPVNYYGCMPGNKTDLGFHLPECLSRRSVGDDDDDDMMLLYNSVVVMVGFSNKYK